MAESWWGSWVPAVAPYAVILRLFVEGRLTADELEVVFLRLYKLDPTEWSPEIFNVLDAFFTDVDAYCGDDKLREKVQGLDEVTLRHRAAETLDALKTLAG